MNTREVTLQDCVDMHQMKGKCSVINDGEVIGFEKEIPATDHKSEQG